MRARIGRNFGPSYDVTIDFEEMQLVWSETWNETGRGEDTIVRRDLTEDESEGMLKSLRMINPIGWTEDDGSLRVMDGTSWSVVLCLDGQELTRGGSYEFARGWSIFCREISAITKMDFG